MRQKNQKEHRGCCLLALLEGVLLTVLFLVGIFFLRQTDLFHRIYNIGMGHIQSLILASTLMMLSFTTFMMGFQADLMAANRKIMEDVQYRLRRFEAGVDADAKERKDR